MEYLPSIAKFDLLFVIGRMHATQSVATTNDGASSGLSCLQGTRSSWIEWNSWTDYWCWIGHCFNVSTKSMKSAVRVWSEPNDFGKYQTRPIVNEPCAALAVWHAVTSHLRQLPTSPTTGTTYSTLAFSSSFHKNACSLASTCSCYLQRNTNILWYTIVLSTFERLRALGGWSAWGNMFQFAVFSPRCVVCVGPVL